MKKNFVILSVLVVLSLVFMFESRNRREPRQAVNSSENPKSLTQEVLEKPLSQAKQQAIQQNEEAPQICRDFASIATSENAGDVLDKIRDGKLTVPQECLNNPKVWSEKIRQYFAKHCVGVDLKLQQNALNCYAGLMKLKTFYLLENVRLDDLNSMTSDQLVARLFDVLSDFGQPGAENELLKLSSELDQRMPHNKTITKVHSMAQLFDYLSEADKPSPDGLNTQANAEKANEFFKSNGEALKLNPNDWEVYEMKLFMLLKTNPVEGIKLAQSLSAQYPQVGLGAYYLGWFKWNEKDREGAKLYLQDAVKREPNTERFRTTLDKIQTADFGTPAFQLTVGFDPSKI